jgi:spoIIIJ-associated protein
MTGMDWVEVRGKSIEEAVALGLAELGLDSPEAAEIEVLQQPQRGFLGFGGQDALVRVKQRSPKRQRRRRRGGKGAGGAGEAAGGEGAARSQRGGGRTARPAGPRVEERKQQHRRDGGGGQRRPRPAGGGEGAKPVVETPEATDVLEQAAIVKRFLVGLLEAFGLEGDVKTRTEGDIIYADVTGDQTEALVGSKGVRLESVLELCRTVVHRRSQAGARIRLDIAGYGERRREALRIYAARLADKIRADGGEVMLEPMNAADRKVVHDAIAEIDGVRSYSEGEDPERSVVIAQAELEG